jgi:hypothetical protein
VTRRSNVSVAILVVVATVAASCGGEDNLSASRSATSEASATRPPANALDLDQYYGAPLAELGLRLTDRGGLIDRRGGGYRHSAVGSHLALYVEPIADHTQKQYIDGIRDVALVFADVFERWPDLESYDVCQEPVSDDGLPGREPLPVTQIEIDRGQAAAIDWSSVSLVDLVRASHADPPGLTIRVDSTVSDDPAFEAVVAEADRTP